MRLEEATERYFDTLPAAKRTAAGAAFSRARPIAFFFYLPQSKAKQKPKAEKPMQTFLPLDDFSRSAACLDDQRLDRQCAEALIILNTIEGRDAKTGWKKHPAVRMWGGYAMALRLYLDACLDAREQRGFKNSIPREKLDPDRLVYPWWLGRQALHASHRALLLRKNPAYYGAFGWSEDPRTPVWWPTNYLQPRPDESLLQGRACSLG